MSASRTLSWPVWTPARRLPTLHVLRLICEDYTRGLGATVRFDRDRFFLTLPGFASHPLRRVAVPAPYNDEGWERWIEVWKGVVEGRVVVDVMTRSGDAVTGAVADGLVGVVGRWWGEGVTRT